MKKSLFLIAFSAFYLNLEAQISAAQNLGVSETEYQEAKINKAKAQKEKPVTDELKRVEKELQRTDLSPEAFNEQRHYQKKLNAALGIKDNPVKVTAETSKAPIEIKNQRQKAKSTDLSTNLSAPSDKAEDAPK